MPATTEEVSGIEAWSKYARKRSEFPALLLQTLALSQTLVQVHPLVLLSVADHASRSAGGSRKRVLGVLLGQDNGKTINIANSFAVPFEEDESVGAGKNSWFLDHDYIESMMGMYRKINGECAGEL